MIEHGKPVPTVVYVKRQANGRHHVFVRYPGCAPHLLLSCPDREEAEHAARGYSIKHAWKFEDGGQS